VKPVVTVHVRDYLSTIVSRAEHNQEIITTLDLHITAAIITAGFARTGSDVPSLPVMSLKMKK